MPFALQYNASSPTFDTANAAASDERSAKRHAVTPASPAVIPFEAAVWTSILEFLPDSAEQAVKESSATLQTLLTLRLVNKHLAELLHSARGVTSSGLCW